MIINTTCSHECSEMASADRCECLLDDFPACLCYIDYCSHMSRIKYWEENPSNFLNLEMSMAQSLLACQGDVDSLFLEMENRQQQHPLGQGCLCVQIVKHSETNL